jgi:hypothetical protein
MEIEQEGERRVLAEKHTMHLWIYEELRRLIERSGTLELVAVRGETREHERIPLDSHINGEMGNLYFILQAR